MLAITVATAFALLLFQPPPPRGALCSQHVVVRPRCWPLLAAPEAAESNTEGEPPTSTEAKVDKKALKAEKKALRDQIEALEKQLKEARGTLIDEQDKAKDAGEAGYLLLAANFERARLSAKSAQAYQAATGKMAAVRPLLTFVDEFEALQNSIATTDEEVQTIHKYYEGIYKQLVTVLDSWQVKPFQATSGEPFDAEKHVQVESRPSDDIPSGAIIEPGKQGYTFEGKPLRRIDCVVSSGPQVQVEEEASEEADGGGEEQTEASNDGDDGSAEKEP